MAGSYSSVWCGFLVGFRRFRSSQDLLCVSHVSGVRVRVWLKSLACGALDHMYIHVLGRVLLRRRWTENTHTEVVG